MLRFLLAFGKATKIIHDKSMYVYIMEVYTCIYIYTTCKLLARTKSKFVEQSLHDKLSHLKAANPPRAWQSSSISSRSLLVSSNLATVSNLAKATL